MVLAARKDVITFRRPSAPAADVPFHFGIIVCALRFILPVFSPYYRRLFEVMPYASPTQVCAAASMELARAAVDLARKGLPVVGFDLAGAEAGYPADDQRRRLPVRARPLHPQDRPRWRSLRARVHLPGHHQNATPTASATAPGSSRTT